MITHPRLNGFIENPEQISQPTSVFSFSSTDTSCNGLISKVFNSTGGGHS